MLQNDQRRMTTTGYTNNRYSCMSGVRSGVPIPLIPEGMLAQQMPGTAFNTSRPMEQQRAPSSGILSGAVSFPEVDPLDDIFSDFDHTSFDVFKGLSPTHSNSSDLLEMDMDEHNLEFKIEPMDNFHNTLNPTASCSSSLPNNSTFFSQNNTQSSSLNFPRDNTNIALQNAQVSERRILVPTGSQYINAGLIVAGATDTTCLDHQFSSPAVMTAVGPNEVLGISTPSSSFSGVGYNSFDQNLFQRNVPTSQGSAHSESFVSALQPREQAPLFAEIPNGQNSFASSNAARNLFMEDVKPEISSLIQDVKADVSSYGECQPQQSLSFATNSFMNSIMFGRNNNGFSTSVSGGSVCVNKLNHLLPQVPIKIESSGNVPISYNHGCNMNSIGYSSSMPNTALPDFLIDTKEECMQDALEDSKDFFGEHTRELLLDAQIGEQTLDSNLNSFVTETQPLNVQQNTFQEQRLMNSAHSSLTSPSADDYYSRRSNSTSESMAELLKCKKESVDGSSGRKLQVHDKRQRRLWMASQQYPRQIPVPVQGIDMPTNYRAREMQDSSFPNTPNNTPVCSVLSSNNLSTPVLREMLLQIPSTSSRSSPDLPRNSTVSPVPTYGAAGSPLLFNTNNTDVSYGSSSPVSHNGGQLQFNNSSVSNTSNSSSLHIGRSSSPGSKYVICSSAPTVARLISSIPPANFQDQIWKRREPRAHISSTGSLADDQNILDSISSVGKRSMSPTNEFSIESGGDSYEESDVDHCDTESDNEALIDFVAATSVAGRSSSSGGAGPSGLSQASGGGSSGSTIRTATRASGQQRHFWQYNVQAKGPKGQRVSIEPNVTDPHKLLEASDPVFSSNICSLQGIKHSGKARRGDGNDWKPNPVKLAEIGRQLEVLNQEIMQLAPVAEQPFHIRPRSRKEKNKLASRVCRLKKKAQHEANKIKYYGLKEQHTTALAQYSLCRQLLIQKTALGPDSDASQAELTSRIDEISKNHPVQIAGNTTNFVNGVIENCRQGRSNGGLDDIVRLLQSIRADPSVRPQDHDADFVTHTSGGGPSRNYMADFDLSNPLQSDATESG